MKRYGFAAIMLAAAGCGSGPDDGTKALATVHGELTAPPVGTQTAAGDRPIEVALVWGTVTGAGQKLVAEKVSVTGTFPAAFALELHQAPPASLGFPIAGAKVSVAFIAALEKSDWQQGTLLDKGKNIQVFGLANEQLIYLDHALGADDPLSVVLGGIREAGFHVVDQKTLTPAEVQARAAACHKLLAPQDAGRCDETASDPAPTGMVEAQDGLAHVIQFGLNGPDEVSFITTSDAGPGDTHTGSGSGSTGDNPVSSTPGKP